MLGTRLNDAAELYFAACTFAVLSAAAQLRLAVGTDQRLRCNHHLWMRNSIAHLTVPLVRAVVAHSACEPPVKRAGPTPVVVHIQTL